MKKKAIYLVGIAIVLLICIIAYFKPLSLSNTASQNSKISMIFNEYVIRNGERIPYSSLVKEVETND